MHLPDLVSRVEAMPGQRVVIAVAGVPGAGKTTLVSQLIGALAEKGINAKALPQDGFHHYRSTLAQFADPKEAFRRRGAPFTFDAERFVQTVKLLKLGRTVCAPSFDHALKDPVEQDIIIDSSTKVVFVEGNYVGLAESPWNHLEEICDDYWMVETPSELVLERLIERHVASGVSPSVQEAEQRARGSDWQNALYIKANLRPAHLVLHAA